MLKKIKIVIGDFSSFSRLVLSDILNAEEDLEVLDTAANGEELIKKIQEHQPDLVIADYYLPQPARMPAFRRIHLEFDIPMLMIISREQVSDAFMEQARALGIYAYVKISPNNRFRDFRSTSSEIVAKVRQVAQMKSRQLAGLQPFSAAWSWLLETEQVLPVSGRPPSCLVVIGGSTGGTRALETVIRGLHQQLSAAVLVAVHLPEKLTRSFVFRIRSLTSLKVEEGRQGLKLESGKVIIAPGDKNMVVKAHLEHENDWRIDFSDAPGDAFDQPSVDLLMQSVAGLAGPRVLGVILSGMGRDGTVGTQAIISKGGETIAQDEASSAAFGMAKSAIEKGNITKVLGLDQIPEYINRFADYHRI